jgi:FkbM family methyltransferase
MTTASRLAPSAEPFVASEEEFRALIEQAPRLRRAFEAERDRGTFVITGLPGDWARARQEVRAAGGRVLAYHDRFLKARRLMFAWRPVLPGRFGSSVAAAWLFAGPATKRYFDGAPAALNRCLWQQPLTGWRQNGRHDPALLQRHGEALRAVMGRLHDAHSRQTYASLIRGRLEGDSGFFSVAPYREYAHPVVRAVPGDVVIDAGAFTGDSAIRFAWCLRARGTIVSLEPDRKNYERLSRRRIPGLVPVNLGVWNERATLNFAQDATASSRIRSDGSVRVEVAAIDGIVAEHKLKRVDLIKLDVEGAEREALEGAEQSLLRFRPKLQVSIYHKKDDLFELPLGLMQRLPDYQWHIGHHGPWHSESDLYGMPRERLRSRFPSASRSART